MSRFLRSWPILLAFLLVFIACFHKALSGEQFNYRDAAHFYYPLYQRVQTEWEAGRWPLWEPEENAGMPLLGNPTAAVLYPGKLIFTALPYPLAVRVYTMAHVALAFAGVFLLARNFGLSPTGASLSALSFAFGAPILFQYCNIIFLVGAAWIPFALRGADRWIRSRNRWGLIELAVALAMQVLGGEPQSAYLVGLCSGAYLLLREQKEKSAVAAKPRSSLRLIILGLLLIVVWTALSLAAAHFLPRYRPPLPKIPVQTFVWTRFVPLVTLGVWGVIGLLFARRWMRREPKARRMGNGFIGLGVAAVLAGMLTAAQLLPVAEFTGLTSRSSDEGSHDYYPFSLEPIRALELLIPNAFGTSYHGNRYWLSFLPPGQVSHRIWVPSLYAGGLTLILALSAAGFRSKSVPVKWFTAIALVSFLASLGEFGSPIFWARRIEALVPWFGAPDGLTPNAIRLDRQIRDGDGSFYWMLTIALPGFRSFRYPSKLLTFTILALGLLAGFGWDGLAAESRKRFAKLCYVFGSIGLLVTAAAFLAGGAIGKALEARGGPNPFGPFETAAAVAGLRFSAIHTLIVVGSSLGLLALAKSKPKLAAALAPLLLATDLAVSNAASVLTAPQSEFDRTPKFLQVIKEYEKTNPSPGPYRVHRMPIWEPLSWLREPSDNRVLDFLRWEKDSLQPKYGINEGIEYTYTLGTAELYDYEFFFNPFDQPVSPELAASIGKIGTHERIVYYPRRGYDLWNTRYFILPGYTIWTDTDRGVASFLQEVERVYPKDEAFAGPDRDAKHNEWLLKEDVQIVRNRRMFPRAWIIHEARFRTPVVGLSREKRREPIEQMLFAGDAIWSDPNRVVTDMRRIAWIETPDNAPVMKTLQGSAPHPDEYVKVVKQEPQRVEMEVYMPRSGVVILGDAYYPGWKLTIDGQPADILRANRMMRGAAVEGSPKVRKLVYSYEPMSFKIGLMVSGLGIFLTLGAAVAALRNPIRQETSA